MKQNQHKGFTLIELLVVVAIIAILSATILAALGSARNRAVAARKESEITSMGAAMELCYDATGTYAGCFTDTASGMNNLTQDVGPTSGSAAIGVPLSSGVVSFNADASSWAYLAPVITGGYYCADSNGFSGSVLPGTTTGVSSIGTSSPYHCQ